MTTTQTHDNLNIPQNNLLDGREYEEHLAFVNPDDLREGDVITDGVGVYQVSRVNDWSGIAPSPAAHYVRHIQVAHTIAGPIMGGLLRGRMERVHLLARRRDNSDVGRGIEGTPAP